MVTNEAQGNANVAQDKKKTFLYEYMESHFKLDSFDEILMNRLQKNRDENKFVYLIQSYRRLESHLYSKSTINNPIITQEQITDAKEQIVQFFNTCLQCPETFDLNNDKIT